MTSIFDLYKPRTWNFSCNDYSICMRDVEIIICSSYDQRGFGYFRKFVTSTIPVGCLSPDVVDTTIPCDCCSELPTIQPVTTRKEGKENKIEDEEHVHRDNQKKKQLLNDKSLIIIGLVLTIPIVLLESLLP